MLPVLMALGAVLLARPARNGGWWLRLALFDGLAAAATLPAPDPSNWERAATAGWLAAEAGWAGWRAWRERPVGTAHGGGARVFAALVLGGAAMRWAGAPDGLGGAAASVVAGIVGAAAAGTDEGRVGGLLVSVAGLLLAARLAPGAGAWGLLPLLLARGALAGMLFRIDPRRDGERTA